MKRGFLTLANAIGSDTRRELGVGSADRFDPWALAAHLEIPVWKLSDLSGCSAAVTHFTTADSGGFSGLTVFHGTKRCIVINDAHSPARQASDLAHELAHCLLEHEPAPAMDENGCRQWDAGMEEEAVCLAGILLVSEEAALLIARRGWTMEEAAERYCVSVLLIRWRLNKTGAKKRVARYAR